MRKLAYIFVCCLILLISIPALSNENIDANTIILSSENSSVNILALSNETDSINALLLTNETSTNNIYYGILLWLEKNIPIAVFVTILLYIISIYREKAKLEQFYMVITNAKKLKHTDLNIAEYHPYYIKKNSHNNILDLIKKGEKKVLIKGVTGLGKTRTIYEIIKELGAKTNYVIIIPSINIKLPIWVPKNLFIFKRKFLLFFDDIDKYVSAKIDIFKIINEFEKNSNDLIVVATCREEEFDILKKEKIHETFKIIEQDFLSIDEGKNLAESFGKEFDLREFDGTAGSIVLDYCRKKDYWTSFHESEKNILRAVKLLSLSNIFFPEIQLVKNVHETIFRPNDCFNTYFQDLKVKKFIKEKNAIFCSDYYLSKVVEDYPVGDQLFSDMLKLRDVLHEMKSWKYLSNLGNVLSISGKHDEAIKCFDKALEINPNSLSTWYNKGHAFHSNKFDEAIKCYDKALEINPDYEEALINKGAIFVDSYGKYDEGIMYFDKALKINPNKEEGLISKGVALSKSGKQIEAITYFDKALEINMNSESAWYNKGVALSESKKFDEAIKCFDKALEINPESNIAWYNKGVALIESKKFDEAIKCYDKAIEIDPNNESAWYGKGAALFESKKFDEAIKCYDKALEIDPKSVSALYDKGLALVNSNKFDEAIKCYDKALEINPDHEEALINKGAIFVDSYSKYSEGIMYFDKALKINPNKEEGLVSKGVALMKSGKQIEAITYFDKALEINPNRVSALYNKGLALINSKKFDEAIKCYNKVLEINPNEEWAWYESACAYSIKGEKEKAISNLKRAIEFDISYKEKAKDDKDFENLLGDEVFKKLVY